jgi:hypothetical protein
MKLLQTLLLLTFLLGLAVAIPLPLPLPSLLQKRPTAVEYAEEAGAEPDADGWGRSVKADAEPESIIIKRPEYVGGRI